MQPDKDVLTLGSSKINQPWGMLKLLKPLAPESEKR